MLTYFTVYTRHAFDYGRIDVIDGGNGLAAAAVSLDRTSAIPDVAECDRILVGAQPGSRLGPLVRREPKQCRGGGVSVERCHDLRGPRHSHPARLASMG
jgi:hypothetical protein